jgi:hypothetical protein
MSSEGHYLSTALLAISPNLLGQSVQQPTAVHHILSSNRLASSGAASVALIHGRIAIGRPQYRRSELTPLLFQLDTTVSQSSTFRTESGY